MLLGIGLGRGPPVKSRGKAVRGIIQRRWQLRLSSRRQTWNHLLSGLPKAAAEAEAEAGLLLQAAQTGLIEMETTVGLNLRCFLARRRFWHNPETPSAASFGGSAWSGDPWGSGIAGAFDMGRRSSPATVPCLNQASVGSLELLGAAVVRRLHPIAMCHKVT